MVKKLIRASLGHNLDNIVRLIHMIFDAELKKVSPFSSLHVILLMMIACDKVTPRDTAMQEMGVYGDLFDEIIKPLVKEGYLLDEDVALEITEKGEQLIAQLWPIHEKTENIVVQGLSEDDKAELHKLLKKMQDNAVAWLQGEGQ